MSLGSRIKKKNRVINWLARELAATIDVLAIEQNLYDGSADPEKLIQQAYEETK